MQAQQTHDRKPSAASASSAATASAVSAKSRDSGSSHSSGSIRKPTGYTIPDPASVEEHGRTFNGYREGKYLLPNDAAEQERLDLAHEMWRLLLFGDLSWAPFTDEPRQVLDIGTGTGIWAIEFAQQHPTTHVIGTDISLIQPPDGSIPSNCTFERDDVEDQWIFDRLFDYIHLRAMLTCFNDHIGVVQKIYDNLRPGGWVEYHEYDPEVFGRDEKNQEDLMSAPIWDWSQRVFKIAKRFGRDMMIARRYKQYLIDAGFVDVTEKIVLAPNKPWSDDPRERRIGQYMQANSLEVLGSVSAKLLPASGMSPEEVEDLIARCRECFLSPELHLYSRMYVVYGRKPRDDELPPKAQAPEASTKQTTQTSDQVPQQTTENDKPEHIISESTEVATQEDTSRTNPAAPEAVVEETTPEIIKPAALVTSEETTAAVKMIPEPTPEVAAGPEAKASHETPQETLQEISQMEQAIPTQPSGVGAHEVTVGANTERSPQETSQAGTIQSVDTEPTAQNSTEILVTTDISVKSTEASDTAAPKTEISAEHNDIKEEVQPIAQSKQAANSEHAIQDNYHKDLPDVEKKVDTLHLKESPEASVQSESIPTSSDLPEEKTTSDANPSFRAEPSIETSSETEGISSVHGNTSASAPSSSG